ncbi:hypothetical protein RUND412_006437 [Rhizina undulata]
MYGKALFSSPEIQPSQQDARLLKQRSKIEIAVSIFDQYEKLLGNFAQRSKACDPFHCFEHKSDHDWTVDRDELKNIRHSGVGE